MSFDYHRRGVTVWETEKFFVTFCVNFGLNINHIDLSDVNERLHSISPTHFQATEDILRHEEIKENVAFSFRIE